MFELEGILCSNFFGYICNVIRSYRFLILRMDIKDGCVCFMFFIKFCYVEISYFKLVLFVVKIFCNMVFFVSRLVLLLEVE